MIATNARENQAQSYTPKPCAFEGEPALPVHENAHSCQGQTPYPAGHEECFSRLRFLSVSLEQKKKGEQKGEEEVQKEEERPYISTNASFS